MSRRSHDENFVKSQLVAFCKALSKAEAPLKQKHVRALIVGTHKQHSARIFWHAVSRVQLEKNPVLTWKFCHLLHKLIRDGHRKVTADSMPHCSRLVQLGNFWQHLRTSGYGMANTSYCKMLVSRLQFHKKYPTVVGSLCLASNQLDALTSDINETYELAIDMLDQMDELLGLKATVMNILDAFRWSSLIPQGQCLLAPLILVILDTSKFYDFLVKALFKLHARIPPDTLVGHRERFYETFRKTRKFYEEAASLQYFKYLVSIPTLPSMAPNFLQASDLDSYQTPQAYLHVEASSESGGDVTPPDSQSLCEETIIDLSTDESTVQQLMMVESQSQYPQQAQSQQPQQQQQRPPDEKDELINALRNDVHAERESKERLLNEARLRIEQYENRLVQMKAQIDAQRAAADAQCAELDAAREAAALAASGDCAAHAEAERRVAEKEQKFGKLKSVYENLRQEHIGVLTEVRDLRSKVEAREADLSARASELATVSQALEAAKHAQSVVEEREQTSSSSLHATRQQIDTLEMQVLALSSALEAANAERTSEKSALEADATLRVERKIGSGLSDACSAALLILEQGQEDLQNATSISYPTHLAADSLRRAADYFGAQLADALKSAVPPLAARADDVKNVTERGVIFAHKVADVCVICAAAAYNSAIESFEPVNEECRRLLGSAMSFFEKLRADASDAAPSPLYDEARAASVRDELDKLDALVKALPSAANASQGAAETIEAQLDEEMRRMDAAIQQSVQQIEQLQRKARENLTGARLEVNDKILDSCTSLMEAVRALVARSRDVQDEIVASGREFATTSEFYKRNHLWTEGLLSAASAVGVAATVLVNSADGVISGTSKFEHMIVAAQEIGASVAQLFVSSRVKADKNSAKVVELAAASKKVNACTAAVVAASKSAQQSLADEKLLDFTRLSLHDAKKEEMESQVRTLELEAELSRERARLAALRKQHYHLASLVANDAAATVGGAAGANNNKNNNNSDNSKNNGSS